MLWLNILEKHGRYEVVSMEPTSILLCGELTIDRIARERGWLIGRALFQTRRGLTQAATPACARILNRHERLLQRLARIGWT